jgi:succinate-semialdehyde dehydrogenase / glutarate-semialdehyde dehydrogenase
MSFSLKNPQIFRQQCWIGGLWSGEGTLPVINPATGEIIARVPNMGAGEAEQAVAKAYEAFATFAKLLAKERAAMLRRWFELILQNREDLAQILTAEQGKPLFEARGEIDYAASFVEFYAEEAKRIYGETIPTHRHGARIMVLKQPIGVCAAITPWNFPAAMITRKIAPALAAGCTVVVKPAPDTPLTALALGVLAQQAGFPAGAINIITGDAPSIGNVLTTDPRVRLLGFTGSTAVGKQLMAQAATTVKKVALELGGNAPFVAFEDADLEAAVEGAMLSKYRNAGQTCVCANRIYVHEKIYDEFVGRFTAAVSTLKVGEGTQEGVNVGPLINEKAVAKVEAHVADALSKGASLTIGGKRLERSGTFFAPTVIAGANETMLISREETFGPLAPIFKFSDEETLIKLCNNTDYGLAAYFYSRDIGRIFRVAEALEFGMIGVNAGVMATEVAPFGGVKQSGLGREGSRHGIEEYLEMKYILLAGLGA